MLASAWACPDVAREVGNAEQDALSYFIADAQKGLAAAAAGFACAPVETPVLVRFWLAKAMVSELSEDGQTTPALAAARALAPEQFTDILGAELKAKWAATDPAPLSPALDIKIRGRKNTDRVLVDGQPVSPATTPPGLHLIQLERDGAIVAGRVVAAEVGGLIEFSAESSAPAPLPGLAIRDLPWKAPLDFSRRPLKDANGETVGFGTVLGVALMAPEGRDLLRKRRRNGTMQGLALTTAGLGALLVLSSEAPIGEPTAENVASASSRQVAAGVAIGITGLTWEFVLRRKRRFQRDALVEVANGLTGG